MNIITINVGQSACGAAPLLIGYAGEDSVDAVDFDFSAWAQGYGEGTIALELMRASDTEPYPAILTVDGTTARWTVSDVDTARSGPGVAQLIYKPELGTKKSAIYKFYVGRSLTEPGRDDPWGPIIERMEEILAEMQQQAAAADQSAQAASGSVQDAEAWATGERGGEPVPATDETHENNAKYYAEQAKEVADSIPESYEDFTRDVVLVQEDQPTAKDNRLWVLTEEGEEITVPTYGELIDGSMQRQFWSKIKQYPDGKISAGSRTFQVNSNVIQSTGTGSNTTHYSVNISGTVMRARSGSVAGFTVYDEDFIDTAIFQRPEGSGGEFLLKVAVLEYPATSTGSTIYIFGKAADGTVERNIALCQANDGAIINLSVLLAPYKQFAIYYLRQRSNSDRNNTVILELSFEQTSVTDADLTGALDTYTASIFNAEPYTGTYEWNPSVTRYGALFNGKKTVEAFAFFTDPHVFGVSDASRNDERMRNYFKRVQTVYNATPCGFLVCGGDLLNNNTTPGEACYRLGLAKGIFSHLLDGCKFVVGNHDTNSQGRQDEESEKGTGDLTNETIAAIMFRDTDTKKAYYSFKGAHATCYVLDTNDNADTMDAYYWAQIDWLAGRLKDDDPAHAIIFLHVIVNSSDYLYAFPQTCGSVVAAYNAREGLTLNGETYDFSDAHGHVDFWVAGHKHADSVGTLGGIPYFTTGTNSYSSDVPVIDLALVDYDNSTLYLTRVGDAAADRVINF